MGLRFKFDSRPYSGTSFRPRPEIHLDVDSNLLLVATPWGPRSAARKAIDRMLEYFMLAKGDREVTSPFQRLTCLSRAVNNLRTAALIANETLYREDNRAEYRVGVELFGASFVDNEFAWIQVGQPQIMLSRRNGRLLPLGGYVDLALDMSESETLLPALPNQLLGLDSTVNLTLNSFRAQPHDRIVLLSHSAPAPVLYGMEREVLNMETVSRLLAAGDPDTAFWLGILDLASNDELQSESEMRA